MTISQTINLFVDSQKLRFMLNIFVFVYR